MSNTTGSLIAIKKKENYYFSVTASYNFHKFCKTTTITKTLETAAQAGAQVSKTRKSDRAEEQQ